MRRIRRFLIANQTIIIFITLFITGTAGLVVGLLPAIARLQKEYALVQVLKAEVAKLQTKADILGSYDLSTLENNYNVVLTAVPKDVSLTSFISTIDALASQHEVTLGSFNIEGVGSVATSSSRPRSSEEQKYGTRMISTIITVSGQLENIRSFLDNIARVRRFLRIKKFDLTFGDRLQSLDAKVSIDSFYMPYPKTIGKTADVITPLTKGEEETLSVVSLYPLMGYEDSGASQNSSGVPLTADPFSP